MPCGLPPLSAYEEPCIRMNHRHPPVSYRDAGVDIDAGADLVTAIKPAVATTARPEVLGGLGGFGGLFKFDTQRFQEPILVAATDGVGTKLELAFAHQRHNAVGIDLVAMCVNDLIVQGAEPLFFLDYYATGKLDLDTATQVIEGIVEGCREAGAALLGGETAEMPGMYKDTRYDLAGFCVGVVERAKLLKQARTQPGDIIIGVGSSGPHANGFSLIRHILASQHHDAQTPLADGKPLLDALLMPTRIYVSSILQLLNSLPVHALAHITGGGLSENIPRTLAPNAQAQIDLSAWPTPEVFNWLANSGPVAPEEMLRTFNCGIGMTVIVPAVHQQDALDLLLSAGEHAWVIGEIHERPANAAQVRYI